MGVRENFPYSDFHNMNTDWIIGKIANIEKSEENAKASENAAKESEISAKASENAAKASENAAKASENAAKASENAAKASENAAKASENAAKASENAAKASENAANASEINASASASVAEEASENATAMANTLGTYTTTYNAAQTYDIDDIVKNQNNIYKCITAITTPEAWTPEHWELLYVGDEIAKIDKALPLVRTQKYVDNIPKISISWYNAKFDDQGHYFASNDTILMPEWTTHYIKDKKLKFSVDDGYVFNVFFFNSTAYNAYTFVGKAKETKDDSDIIVPLNDYAGMYYSINLSRSDGGLILPDDSVHVHVLREITIKNERYIDIKDFGALENVESTEYIQSAIDYAASVKKPVYIPEGVFVTGSLFIPSNSTLFGNGYKSILKAVNGLNDHILQLTGTENVLVTLDNFHIDGNKSNTQEGVDGIHFVNSVVETPDELIDHYHAIKNMHVDHCSGNGIYMYYTRECFVDSCVTRLNDKNGLFFQGSDSKILNCTASVNAENGYHFITGSKVINCKAFFNKKCGVYISQYARGMKMSNCDLQSNNQGGDDYEAIIDGCDNVRIDGISIDTYSNGVYIDGVSYLHLSITAFNGGTAITVSDKPFMYNVIELMSGIANPVAYETEDRYDSHITLNGNEIYAN